jgi:hypothetical protein
MRHGGALRILDRLTANRNAGAVTFGGRTLESRTGWWRRQNPAQELVF